MLLWRHVHTTLWAVQLPLARVTAGAQGAAHTMCAAACPRDAGALHLVDGRGVEHLDVRVAGQHVGAVDVGCGQVAVHAAACAGSTLQYCSDRCISGGQPAWIDWLVGALVGCPANM